MGSTDELWLHLAWVLAGAVFGAKFTAFAWWRRCQKLKARLAAAERAACVCKRRARPATPGEDADRG